MKSPGRWLIEKLDRPDQVLKSTYDFFPAALEIQDTPPSPIGRAVIWVIVLLFVVSVTWAFFGRMDVVAVAPGKIIPSGRVKKIQPLEIGKIKSIHVEEGQRVSRGDLLITLDGTATQAEVDRLSDQLNRTKQQISRQEAFNRILQDGETLEFKDSLAAYGMQIGPDVEEKLGQEQYMLFLEQIREYQFHQEGLKSQLSKKLSEQQRTDASITKLKRTLPLVNERTNSVAKLMEKQLVARDQYLKLEQERIEKEQDLFALQAQHEELQADTNSIRFQLKASNAKAQKSNLSELNDSRRQADNLHQELIKANERNHQQEVASPINGTVQQLSVHTVGGVVTPAQELMTIVPEESSLEVEALILNKDIGFIESGQQAEVKVDTFNFTKYGMIDARLTHVSSDAVSDENLGLVYPAKILLEKTQMEIDNRLVNLSPGMTVSVELKTGNRRIIEYFLSPFLRYKQESIRER